MAAKETVNAEKPAKKAAKVPSEIEKKAEAKPREVKAETHKAESKVSEKKVEVKAAAENKAGEKTAEKKTEAKTAPAEKEAKSASTEKAKAAPTEKTKVAAEKTTAVKAKSKKKYIPFTEKENKGKSKEAYETQKTLKIKKWHPVFRGRFGKKNIRRKSIAKWDKWRKPHGIDLDKGLQHGFRPKIGYRSDASIRGIHPSGYLEILVNNMNDLEKINPKIHAARIGATVGKRKRNIMVAKANEKKIWVLN